MNTGLMDTSPYRLSYVNVSPPDAFILENDAENVNISNILSAAPPKIPVSGDTTASHPQAEQPDVQLEHSDLKDTIAKALGKLKPHLREIIVLKQFQQLKFREIAETSLYGCPLSVIFDESNGDVYARWR